MLFFNNTKMMNKLHLLFFFNIISLIFLTWISHRGNEVGNLNKYIKTKDNIGNTWKVRNDRLLTNDGPQSEIGQSGTSDNITLPGEKNKLKDIAESSEVHENIKKNTSNSMHSYIKKLEHGYTNKKGLKRLDCHYEKKLFEQMYKLDTIVGHVKSKNSYFKKVVWKRYGLRFVIFSLVLLFGIVTSMWFYFGVEEKTGINCDKTNSDPDNKPCTFCKYIQNVILGSNGIMYFPLVIAFLSFIVYILSKVKKYKRLKKKFDITR